MTAPTTDLQQVAEFIAQFVSNPGLALQFAQDPNGTLVAQGLDQVDLESVDLNEAMLAGLPDPGLPARRRDRHPELRQRRGRRGWRWLHGSAAAGPRPGAGRARRPAAAVRQLRHPRGRHHDPADDRRPEHQRQRRGQLHRQHRLRGRQRGGDRPGFSGRRRGRRQRGDGRGLAGHRRQLGRPEPEQLRRFRAGRRGQQRPDRARPQLRRGQRRRHRRPGPGRQHQHRHHQRRHDRRAGPVQQHQHRRGRRRQRPGHGGRQRERDREHRRRQQRGHRLRHPAPSPPSATRR